MNTRKIIASIAAAIMVFGCTVTSFGATLPDSGVISTNETSLTLEKVLNVSNPNLTKIAGPGIAYTYSVTPATVASKTMVSDGTTEVSVKPGPANGLNITSSPSFAKNANLTASSTGAPNLSTLVLSVDLTKFNVPGIYRYKLAETTAASVYSDTGVTKGQTQDRFVDVYIQNGGNGFIASGFVVGTDANNDGTLEKKGLDADLYETVNIVLEKEVTGAMGDKNNQFPFAGTISNKGKYFYAKKGSAPTTSDSTQTAEAVSTTLANGEKFYVSGLATNASYTYVETNNTDNPYKVSVNGANQTKVAGHATKSSGAQNAKTVPVLKFTNNLNAVTPTGVIMTFGPYIGMILVAGLLIFVRRRAQES